MTSSAGGPQQLAATAYARTSEASPSLSRAVSGEGPPRSGRVRAPARRLRLRLHRPSPDLASMQDPEPMLDAPPAPQTAPTAHEDTFARDHLPPRELWPVL